jgi:hypothetical protein
MAEKVTLKLAAAAAAYVARDTPRENRLQAARGMVPVAGADLVTMLFFLGHDPDPAIKGAAIESLRELTESQLLAVAGSDATHPKILDMLARIHYQKPEVVDKLLAHPGIEGQTLAFLVDKGVAGADAAFREREIAEAEAEQEEAVAPEEAEASDEVDEESEEFKSKYKLSLQMGIAEKIKMALTGDKEWRGLLIKDSNKLVSGAVVKNPRITEPEILTISKSAIQNDEIMRLICVNKEWLKNYSIRKALAVNPKTPLPAALRFVATLTEKDLAALAKSKNVSTTISSQARRLLMNKKKK